MTPHQVRLWWQMHNTELKLIEGKIRGIELEVEFSRKNGILDDRVLAIMKERNTLMQDALCKKSVYERMLREQGKLPPGTFGPN
jgi:hypothetical protein